MILTKKNKCQLDCIYKTFFIQLNLLKNSSKIY